MANTRSSGVLVCDTTATIPGNYRIKAVKYIGAASGTATIKADSASGTTIWEESGTTNVHNSSISAYCPNGIHVTVATGVKVYIYTEL